MFKITQSPYLHLVSIVSQEAINERITEMSNFVY